MYHIVIIEDDNEAALKLTQALERWSAERAVELTINHVTQAEDFMSTNPVADLVFMDIQLPGLSGLEAATLLRSYNQTVLLIFITDLAQYAVRGYEVDALDFIVKPVTYPLLAMRMDKALRILKRSHNQKIMLPTKENTYVVDINAIVKIEVSDHNLIYHIDALSASEHRLPTRLTLRKTLASAEQELSENHFIRTDNATLVNMAHVLQVSGDKLLLTDAHEAWFSRSRKRAALARLATYFGGTL